VLVVMKSMRGKDFAVSTQTATPYFQGQLLNLIVCFHLFAGMMFAPLDITVTKQYLGLKILAKSALETTIALQVLMHNHVLFLGKVPLEAPQVHNAELMQLDARIQTYSVALVHIAVTADALYVLQIPFVQKGQSTFALLDTYLHMGQMVFLIADCCMYLKIKG
jgi:hypothetical protein